MKIYIAGGKLHRIEDEHNGTGVEVFREGKDANAPLTEDERAIVNEVLESRQAQAVYGTEKTSDELAKCVSATLARSISGMAGKELPRELIEEALLNALDLNKAKLVSK